jgi:lipoic acid synthetase
MKKSPQRLPPWFRTRLVASENLRDVRRLISSKKLHTVCRSAACPNRTECWNARTATFMILGNVCTRGCAFCNVPKGTPAGPDLDEPNRVAQAVASLQLNYVVITSVTRDDLVDGGASLFTETMKAIRARSLACRIEVLVPDFQGSGPALRTVLDEKPDVLNHNIETVPSLYHRVRPQADYQRSLELLASAKKAGTVTKTGLMLGLGEGIDEVLTVMRNLRETGCSILTIGQYLQPGKNHLLVEKYYHPDEFSILRAEALSLGFLHVAAGPLVRSSYQAGEYGKWGKLLFTNQVKHNLT